ncbi:ATP-binding protein [Magnetospirillum aberrantis]|uniref:histidine kinase n=1 Tax=Magnetospirillum aberrantis SpK TaxID=908842 RepID=A0A7C9QVU5_9PROT|nr:ATP-binding protein [Magnetospirillum aberrantis]NFV81722.1 PAS domain-containing protein [Magnetospirillum aberrantis SpK]
MERHGLTMGRVVGAALLLSVPTAALLVVLVAALKLNMMAAIIGWVVVVFLIGLLVRPYLASLSAVTSWARALAAGYDTTPPAIERERPVAEIVGAIAQLRRAWQARQRELAESARWNETLFDNLPDPLILLSEDRRIVRLNQAGLGVFGTASIGRDLAAVLRDPSVLEATDEVLAGASGREGEFTLPVPVERSFLVRVERLGSRAMDDTVAVLALHDLTAIKRMEQMRADFVANASHELRTPLATLLGFIETLRGPARDDADARERFLLIMQEQASRMARLINDLLSLSRIELNEHSKPRTATDLGRIVETATEALQPLARARGMTIVATVASEARIVVGEADELAQLVQNLLDNAVKYGRDGTPVEVSLGGAAGPLPPTVGNDLTPDTAVVLAVKDHGDGIGKEHLPRLTERFYRVDTARSRKMGGTGLGLAIVKHIVNRHRGALVVESVVGQGSTFAVYLPRPEIDDKAVLRPSP